MQREMCNAQNKRTSHDACDALALKSKHEGAAAPLYPLPDFREGKSKRGAWDYSASANAGRGSAIV